MRRAPLNRCRHSRITRRIGGSSHTRRGPRISRAGIRMANEGSSRVERTVSFIIRLVVSLMLPAWGLIMIVLGVTWGMGWWIATGLVVLAIGVVLFAGSSLATPFLGGRGGLTGCPAIASPGQHSS